MIFINHELIILEAIMLCVVLIVRLLVYVNSAGVVAIVLWVCGMQAK